MNCVSTPTSSAAIYNPAEPIHKATHRASRPRSGGLRRCASRSRSSHRPWADPQPRLCTSSLPTAAARPSAPPTLRVVVPTPAPAQGRAQRRVVNRDNPAQTALAVAAENNLFVTALDHPSKDVRHESTLRFQIDGPNSPARVVVSKKAQGSTEPGWKSSTYALL